MVELNSDKSLSCKLCSDETTKNLCIANCIGCKDLFCFDHLLQHRKQLSNDIHQLIQRHNDINEKSFPQLTVSQHVEYIDKWENETIELIQTHTKYVKEKIQTIFHTYKTELKKFHTMLGAELDNKQNTSTCIEQNLTDLSQQIEQLDKEIHRMNNVIQQMTNNELNQIVKSINLSANTIGKTIQWNYSHEIKLDSTYGYMAANHRQIFLGWKNRIVIYNINGTKHDETRLQSTETYGELCDLIWSSTMQRFFILCQKSLFVHYPSSSQVEILSNISLINQDNEYISITTNENNLFILNKKSLEIWKLNNKLFQLDNTILITFIIKNPYDENICSIRANEQNLAVLIQNNKTHTWRLDLFNFYPFHRTHMGTSFDHYNQENLGSITAFTNSTYLFMNWETKLMRMIDQNNLNEIIDYNAYNACLLDTQRMLVVNYMTYLKVYSF
ncbi:unnamed protein product [Adineta steineri]|uniref:Uncharacterized protein n=1 Tax=Adineta steineri TaxID=433720 RepID=A0A815REU2_9BILA|nr:unnamed protein product [Adineta steineri]CAF1637317.1 unnamed protein product [Adineta steineri]